MSGGSKISGNRAEGKTEGAVGGGVAVWSHGIFTMKDGTVSNNIASGTVSGEGGGVTLDNNGKFIMEGGTISGNTASGDIRSEGGGVHLYRATFTMKGGVISGNTAEGNGRGGGVSANNGDKGKFIMEGGTIYGNNAESGFVNSAQDGASLVVISGPAKWGTGGTYTKGGVAQPGGDIGSGDYYGIDDTLTATP
jgi:hypothetical protein